MQALFVSIAVVLAVIGNVPYLRDVLRNRIQPHPFTWLVWSVVSAITLSGQIVKGAGIGSIPTAASEAFTIIIFIASLRYGFKHIQKHDAHFLCIALLGLIPWLLTSDPTLSVVTVVSIDLVAFVPTLRKAWRKPHSETPILFAMNVLRHILTLSALDAYNVATTLHSIAMIVTNALMTTFILARRGKTKPAEPARDASDEAELANVL